jgi:hypothetical protein
MTLSRDIERFYAWQARTREKAAARKQPRKPIRKRRPDRKAKLFARNFLCLEFVHFSKRQPCAILGEAPRQWPEREKWGNDTAHVKDRGMGGCNSSYKLTIGACPP